MKLINLIILTLYQVTASSNNVANSVMEDMESKQWIDYLVQLQPYPNLSKKLQSNNLQDIIKAMQTHSKSSQVDLLKKLQSHSNDISYFKPYFLSNTIAITSSKKVLKELMNHDSIQEISSNNKFKVTSPTSLDSHDAIVLNDVTWDNKETLWSIKEIGADQLSSEISTNAGKLRYANADTGVEYTHPAISQNYMGYKGDGTYDHNYSWWDANKKSNDTRVNFKCGINSLIPCGDDDHGTHTMSTVVGNQGLGMSPTTKWMACKNMNMNFGSPESYLGCLQFFLAPTDLNGNNPRADLRPHVIGNSYTCPPEEGCSAKTFSYALEALKSAGILMSVSAGNNGAKGCGSIEYPPAIDSNSFTVGATNYKSNRRAYFSSLGPVPGRPGNIGLDIVAPGVNITGAALGGKYRALSGTSMASPHVSGAALIVMAACPHLTRKVDEIEQLLRQTATPIAANLHCGGDTPTTYPNNEFGHGKINVKKAIEQCQSTL